MLYTISVEFLVLNSGLCPVEEFFSELDDKALAKIFRLIKILQTEGSLPFPHARKMQGLKGLWELRILSHGKAVRFFYTYAEKNKIILLSGFIKKSQETPRREIDKALSYLMEIEINR